MAETHRVGSLDIAQDLEFERREWRVQYVAWVVVLLLLAAGALGLFGSGLLSPAQSTSGRLALDYDRLARQRAPALLRLQVAPAPGAAADEIPIWIDRSFLDMIEVKRFEPEPVEMEAGEDRAVYVFLPENPAQPAEITVRYEPIAAGPTSIRLGIVDDAEIAVDQFIYP